MLIGVFVLIFFQGIDPAVYETKVCQGRVVFLKPNHEDCEGPVSSGVVVIDSGPYTGQRVEFEADDCFLYGYPLGRAHLGYLFHSSKQNK